MRGRDIPVMRSSWLMTPATTLSTPGLLRLARDLVKVSVVVVRLSVRTERGRSLADIQ